MSRISPVVRAQLRQRAGSRCEYCHKPERVSTYGYHADHIIPLKHGGTSELDNLAWACFECNVSKGENIASYDRTTGKLTPLFHPRTQNWDEHFEFDDEVLRGKDAIGRVTINILDINHPDQLETRRTLIESGEW